MDMLGGERKDARLNILGCRYKRAVLGSSRTGDKDLSGISPTYRWSVSACLSCMMPRNSCCINAITIRAVYVASGRQISTFLQPRAVEAAMHQKKPHVRVEAEFENIKDVEPPTGTPPSGVPPTHHTHTSGRPSARPWRRPRLSLAHRPSAVAAAAHPASFSAGRGVLSLRNPLSTSSVEACKIGRQAGSGVVNSRRGRRLQGNEGPNRSAAPVVLKAPCMCVGLRCSRDLPVASPRPKLPRPRQATPPRPPRGSLWG
ncbi:hypothetical protein E2C01_047827 [Portunus trituberculatus]|uniref:Uncharacterized protein n=1 Tax=Portunus trituberculatus TaxID=210409 RepID=A0A5B7GBK4_PORTR|nr:hypothetical protein [Portunus trituberculatus]